MYAYLLDYMYVPMFCIVDMLYPVMLQFNNYRKDSYLSYTTVIRIVTLLVYLNLFRVNVKQ